MRSNQCELQGRADYQHFTDTSLREAGTDSRNRTCNLLIMIQALSPIELYRQVQGVIHYSGTQPARYHDSLSYMAVQPAYHDDNGCSVRRLSVHPGTYSLV